MEGNPLENSQGLACAMCKEPFIVETVPPRIFCEECVDLIRHKSKEALRK